MCPFPSVALGVGSKDPQGRRDRAGRRVIKPQDGSQGEDGVNMNDLLPLCWLGPPTFVAWPPAAVHSPSLLFLASKMGLFGEMLNGWFLKSGGMAGCL